MRKLLVIFVVLVMLLVACAPAAPSEGDIQTAIAQTAEAMPTNTAEPTIPKPTATVKRIKLPTTTPVTPTGTPAFVSCADLHPEFVESFDSFLEQWDQVNEIAANTPRIDLSDHVTKLQSIRNEFQQMDTPPCGTEVHGWVSIHMDLIYEFYLSFMAAEEAVFPSTRIENLEDRIAESYSDLFVLKERDEVD